MNCRFYEAVRLILYFAPRSRFPLLRRRTPRERKHLFGSREGPA